MSERPSDLERRQNETDGAEDNKRPRIVIEVEVALNIALAMDQSIAHLERWWPPSKRGSNGQHALDEIKQKQQTIVQCLRDASK